MILALRKLRQAKCKFEACLDYIVTLCFKTPTKRNRWTKLKEEEKMKPCF